MTTHRAMSPVERRVLLVLLAAATVLLLAGYVLPMLTLRRFVFFEDAFSVLSGLIYLLERGHFLLFLLVGGFSVVLPLVKIAVLTRLLVRAPAGPGLHRLLRLMHDYGRWAMLDVLVVAVLIVTVKLGAIASVEVHVGLYIFGAAVLLIMIITHRLASLSRPSTP